MYRSRANSRVMAINVGASSEKLDPGLKKNEVQTFNLDGAFREIGGFGLF